MSLDNFAHPSYQEHNKARLTHLESLHLTLSNKRVLEVGSGPGDHTGFYVGHGNQIVSTDARLECVEMVKLRYPTVEAHVVDLNVTASLDGLGMFDVVHCYGLLYHLENPEVAIASMAGVCNELLLLETCVSHGDSLAINHVAEGSEDFTQASTGKGCRPTRGWVFATLLKHFQHVYVTRTQPKHPEFPIDWTVPPNSVLSRSVFVASREKLDSARFSDCLLDVQRY